MQFVREPALVDAARLVAVREHGDVLRAVHGMRGERERRVAYGGHDLPGAVQERDAAVRGDERELLDVGDRVVDAPAQPAVDVERAAAVRPPDLQRAQQVGVVLLRRQCHGLGADRAARAVH